MKMVVAANIKHLSARKRYFLFAKAYVDSAASLCDEILRMSEATWPRATVILFLTAHAVELFLKGALIEKISSSQLERHEIRKLFEHYIEQYPAPAFRIDLPFNPDIKGIKEMISPIFSSEKEIDELIKSMPVESVMYRYPYDKKNEEWRGAYGFEAISFKKDIEKLRIDFSRIEALIDS